MKLEFRAIAAYITLGIAFVILSGYIAVQVYPFTPIKYSEAVLNKDVVRAGDMVTYTAFFEKYIDQVGTMQRYLVAVNGNKMATIALGPPGLADAQVGDTSKMVRVEIPECTVPGRYKIKWVVGYDYFGLRTVYVRTETPEFEVRAR